MALSSVLSAMRQIILDAPQLPESPSDRLNYLKNSFPSLSQFELEDLNKIPPEKFRIYTTSIFAGERNLLKNNFPFTCALLEKHWTAAFGEPLTLFQLAKDLHRSKPWRSTASVVLGRNFVEYISENLQPVIEICPAIVEIAEMELLVRKVRKMKDGTVEACDGLSIQSLLSMTIGEVMALKYAIPRCVTFKSFSYDVIQARSEFIKEREQIPEKFESKTISAAIGRNSEGYPRWITLAKSLADFIAGKERENFFTIEELAEVSIGQQPQGLSEEELFRAFVAEISNLSQSGIIVLKKIT